MKEVFGVYGGFYPDSKYEMELISIWDDMALAIYAANKEDIYDRVCVRSLSLNNSDLLFNSTKVIKDIGIDEEE